MDAMQLSLSVRIAETPQRKDCTAMAFEPLMQLAATLGYKGISMRASQASIDTPAAQVAAMKQLLDELGLAVSMCTGTVGLAANDDQATAPLRDITPHLDLAERFGCDLVRVMIKEADDIPWTRRAADIAHERGMRLVHQTHIRTLCETVAETLDVVHQVGRPNFGVTYEPSNLAICGDDYGPEALRQLGPHLFNVYLQNWHIHPEGSDDRWHQSRGGARRPTAAVGRARAGPGPGVCRAEGGRLHGLGDGSPSDGAGRDG